MTRKKKQRCASCYAEKGKLHGLYCQRENRDLFPGGPVYKDSYVTDTSSSSASSSSSSSGSCDTGSSSSHDGGGSSCGSSC